MLGRTRHFPARHGWDQCCKVRLYKSPKLGESKERSQAGYHLSSPTASVSRRMASHKRPYLRNAKRSEIDSSAAELLGKEPVDMPRVVVNRGMIQPSFFLQKDTVFVR